MNWHEIVLKVDSKEVEIAIGILSECGIDGLIIEDSSVFDDLMRDKSHWDYADDSLTSFEEGISVLKGYVRENTDLKELMETLSKRLKEAFSERGNPSFDLKAAPLLDQDWNTEWKKYFKPLKIGRRIVIKPTWESLDEAFLDLSEKRIVIELDPGLAFGTGTHETTRLCLEFLEEHVRKGMRVLDIGCGSGILSLAAAKLGASEVIGVDFDADAVAVARANIEKNREKETCRVIHGDLLEALEEPADLMVANIIYDVILQLLDTASSFIKPGGIFIASGIIEEKTSQIMQAVEASDAFDLIEARRDNGWTALLMRRREGFA